MKKILLLVSLIGCIHFTSNAQVTNVESGATFLDSLTNFAIAPYFTYAPKAPTKYGGGALLIYNVNNNIGAAMGIDWLGSFSMISGNVTFKVPTHPLTFIGLPNIVATPNVIAGISSPMSGSAAGHLSGVVGAGLDVDLFTLGKGKVGVGYEAVQWTDAGDFSGLHHEVFVAYHLGF